MALHDQHEAFCLLYLGEARFDATAAYRAVYGPVKGAKQSAHALMEREDVRERLAELSRATFEKLEITVERIAEEYARIAFLDPRQLVEWTARGVSFRPSDELDARAAAVVAEVKESATPHGPSLSIKFHDKLGALNSLAKWKQMFSDAPEVVNINYVVEVPVPLSPEEWQKRYGKGAPV